MYTGKTQLYLNNFLNPASIWHTHSPQKIIILPFKDQKSADTVRRQLSDLGKKIDRVLQPLFTGRKTSEDLKVTETKSSLVNQQALCMNLNVIRVMRTIEVTRTITSTLVLRRINIPTSF